RCTTIALLAEIALSLLFAPDEVDLAGCGHNRDQHVLATIFAAQSEAGKSLRACRALSKRANAFLSQSGAIAGAIACYRTYDCNGGTAARKQGRGHSLSSGKIENDQFAATGDWRSR